MQTHTEEPPTKSHLSDLDSETLLRIATDVMFVQMPEQFSEFAQMPAHVGIKKFGEEAIMAMVKEYVQLDKGAIEGKPVIEGIHASDLSSEDKKRALEAVNLIKKKRVTEQIKGRACANGSKQRQYLKEDESVASPTLSLEALLATLVIDAYEGRDVCIFDIPGAYLHAEMPPDKMVIMRI